MAKLDNTDEKGNFLKIRLPSLIVCLDLVS